MWQKIWKDLKKAQKRTYTWTYKEQHLRKLQIGKQQGMMANMDSGFKNSSSSTTANE